MFALAASPVLAAALPAGAEKLPPLKLIELAKQSPASPEFRQSLTDTLGDEALKKGTAITGEGARFLWAVEAESEPALFVDQFEKRGPLTRVSGTNLWFQAGELRPGISHSFHYVVGGKRFGGQQNVAAYLPESYEQPGVPQGKLSEKIVHTSKIYDSMESEYWIYVPAQYDAAKPACVMVWNDGGGHINRTGGARTLNVIDNLTQQGKIPVMIQVFINPGDISKATGTPTHTFVSEFSRKTGRSLRDSMRSTEYDTVSDRYPRFLKEEILADVARKYTIRQDGYSHGIAGDSSGAIAAFNAAWQRPDLFSRVLSRIGTYTSIQWQPGVLDGGNIFPFTVRKTPRKNLRVWLSDGADDLENEHGSWPLQNIQMANSLKMAGYDYHFSWSTGSHNSAHGAAEAPLSLAWLWRDYDPAKTEQTFQQEEAERSKPYYRVMIYNRD
jgi:enterochelin esterase-like enzyme